MICKGRTRNTLTGLCCAAFVGAALGVSAADRAEAQNLDAAVRRLFLEKSFDPTTIPFHTPGADVTEVDPLVVRFEWESVRPRLSELYHRYLGISPAPTLRMQFERVPGPTNRLRVRALLTAEDERLRMTIAKHLNCPADAFTTGELCPLTAACLMAMAGVKSKYKVGGNLALSLVAADLLAMLQAARGPLARYSLAGRARFGEGKVEILSGWKYYRQKDEAKRYFWRAVLLLEPSQGCVGVWVLNCSIQLGRQLPSQSEPKTIGNMDDEHVELSLGAGATMRAPPGARPVGTSRALRPADELSPLNTLRKMLMEQCLSVLLEP